MISEIHLFFYIFKPTHLTITVYVVHSDSEVADFDLALKPKNDFFVGLLNHGVILEEDLVVVGALFGNVYELPGRVFVVADVAVPLEIRALVERPAGGRGM